MTENTEIKLNSYQKWQKNHREHLNEYSREFYKKKVEDEEWRLHNRELVKENMRKYRIKLKEERIANGWTPKKRGRKPKINTLENITLEIIQ